MTLTENISYLILSIASPNVIVAITTTAILILYWYISVSKERPPGPLGLPILGYLPFIGTNPNETFCKLADKYGPVVSFYMGNQLVVFLNNYEAIKEAFVKNGDAFAGRPHDMNFTAGETDRYNIVISDGNIWKEHRRFAMTVLRDCGVGKLSIESQIMDEIQHFLSELKKFHGKPKNFAELLSLSVSNNICILIFGKRFEYDDPWFISAKRFFDEMLSIANPINTFFLFPWIRKVPGIAKLWNQEKVLKAQNQFKESVFIMINERKKRHVDGQRDNYMNAFLEEQKARDIKEGKGHVFPDDALENNLRSLMTAGTETTANTLQWCILYMIKYPEVQKRVQNEIDEFIGTERTSCWNDRLRTPYTEATIYEVQRMSTLVPNNVPHRSISDCEILGHKIPKDSIIMSNLWAVHMDPKLWNDPTNFRPERFIAENGEIKKSEYLIPFSMGKRQCLGENLARMELYLYFTSMLQKFTFMSADGAEPNMEPRIGITVCPKFFNVKALERNVK